MVIPFMLVLAVLRFSKEDGMLFDAVLANTKRNLHE